MLCEQIAISPRQMKYLLDEIKRYIPQATVWAFGSRVGGTSRPASDLDLAVHCDKETAQKELPKLNERLIESDLPFKVQLLDFDRLPENMQKNIKAEYAALYQPREETIEKKEKNGEKGPDPFASCTKRPFSLWLYLLIVFGLSWPFQIIAAIWGLELLPRYTLHAISMTMVTVGTFITGRYVFKDGFAEGGWHWGKLKHYLVVIGLALFLWAVPAMIDWRIGKIVLPEKLTLTQWIWVTIFLVNFIPCFGEEFGWRGYVLPRLARRYTPRKAVFIHSVIWWIWHWPVLSGVGAWMGIESAEEMGLPASAAAIIMAAAVLVAGAAPAILNGVVFAYFWVWSGSLAVVTVLHLADNGIRDSIQSFVGSGPVSEIWPVIVTIILGTALLWKGNWEKLVSSNKG